MRKTLCPFVKYFTTLSSETHALAVFDVPVVLEEEEVTEPKSLTLAIRDQNDNNDRNRDTYKSECG